jgi:sigma-E factor negative regulatory protein RseC
MGKSTVICTSGPCDAGEDFSSGSASQPAIVRLVHGGHIQVEVDRRSACAACRSTHCHLTDHQTALFDLEYPQSSLHFRVGDQVNLIVNRSTGITAIILGYILPCLLVVTGLFSCYALTHQEGLSGLVSLSLLIPYYGVLFLNREILKKKIHIEIQKIPAI